MFCFRRKLLLFARFTGGAVFEGTYPGVRGPHVFHFCPRRPVAGLRFFLLLVRTPQSPYCTVNTVRYGEYRTIRRMPSGTTNTVRCGEYRTMRRIRHGDCRTIRILCRAVRHTLHNITHLALRHKRSTKQPNRLLIVPNTVDVSEFRSEGRAESVQCD